MTIAPALESELRRLWLSLKLAGKSVYIGFVIIDKFEQQQVLQRIVDQAIMPDLCSNMIDLSQIALGERVQLSDQANCVTHLFGLYFLPIPSQHIVLRSLNRAREYLGRSGGPIVIWITPDQVRTFAEHAPDLWSWHSGIYDFTGQQELFTMVRPSLSHYPNPYDFVLLEGSPAYINSDVQQMMNQACIRGVRGQIMYTLEVLTPLCIHQNPGEPNRQRQFEFAHLGGAPTLPATSLKGMLRGVHEVVTNSTMGLLKSGSRNRYRERVPTSYLPGQTHERLTWSEALFGMVGGTGDASVGYAGRVLLADLAISVRLQPQQVSRPQGGQPKPEHESFYFERERSGAVLGRKFYYHQQDYRQVLDVYANDRRMPVITVQSVPSGTRLQGQLRFFNLHETELAALIYTLVLEDGLAHKLGYGKPLGLGSVRISITRLDVEPSLDPPARFLSYGDTVTDDWTARVVELRDQARTTWLARPQGQRSYDAFRAIARWPQTENFVYPDFGFFRSERNAAEKTPLWIYQGRTMLHPGGRPSVSGSGTPPTPRTHSGTARNTSVPHQAPPVEEVPVQTGPRQVVDLRPIGRIEADTDGEPIVRGVDDKRYLLLAESASRAVLRSLIDQMRAGMAPKVRYRPERRKIDKKNRNVALDVEPVEGTE